MKKIILYLVSASSLCGLNAQAFGRATLSVDQVVQKSLNYLAHEQYQEKDHLYSAGEWPANMKAYLLPAALGVGKLFSTPTEEPTAFATSSILNLLSEAYLAEPNLQQIPTLLEKGISSLDLYREGDLYSYYQSQNYKGVKVHAPLADGYVPNYIRGLTNVPLDADTTSVSYMARAYFDLIKEQKNISTFTVPQTALDAFNTHRDLNRTPHYYNFLDSIKNSGAFLTWFQHDHDPKMPRGVFAKPDKGTRIPFGFNDVDCVVNANVMRLLTLTQNSSHPGYNDSCKLLNFSILKNKQSQCGIYYPNSYAVFFSTSNVYKAGAKCLEESKEAALRFIISTQNDDGSWANEPGIGRTDLVQSTALALNALMNYTEPNTPQFRSAIKAGVQFLLQARKEKKDSEIYWPGEVFFSAVAQARNTVLWRSDSYTTALVVLALTKAQNYLGESL